MITKMTQIPVTEENYPFQSAAKKCNFDALGYIEDEYFMSGTANVYTEKDKNHQVEPIFEGAPYTTRLLIRRPADPKKFSGNVVIEILNASAMMDIDRMWVNTWQYLTRNGDIYIGITSKGHVVDTLKRFNPERYAEINWVNPMPEREAPQVQGPFGCLPQYEAGLYWDMQTDLARLLRTDSELRFGRSPLFPPKRRSPCGRSPLRFGRSPLLLKRRSPCGRSPLRFGRSPLLLKRRSPCGRSPLRFGRSPFPPFPFPRFGRSSLLPFPLRFPSGRPFPRDGRSFFCPWFFVNSFASLLVAFCGRTTEIIFFFFGFACSSGFFISIFSVSFFSNDLFSSFCGFRVSCIHPPTFPALRLTLLPTMLLFFLQNALHIRQGKNGILFRWLFQAALCPQKECMALYSMHTYCEISSVYWPTPFPPE